MKELQVAALFERPEAAREALADLQSEGFRAHLSPIVASHLRPRAARRLGFGTLLGALIGAVLVALLVLATYPFLPFSHPHPYRVLIGAVIIGGIVGGVVGQMLGSLIALHAVAAPQADSPDSAVVIVETTLGDDARTILERHGGRPQVA